jgi:hypothetical protein
MAVKARSEKQQQARGRRRARATMRIVTAMCAVAALGIGATELSSTGLDTFVARPEGVGATPPADEAAPSSPGRSATANHGGAAKASPVPKARPVRPACPPDTPAPDHRGKRAAPKLHPLARPDHAPKRDPCVGQRVRPFLVVSQ